jgi:Mlc titration factor MtfA (ptsG expression regulator)
MFWFKGRRRKRLLETPLDEARRAVVEHAVPLSRRLGPDHRRRFEGLVQLFLDGIGFEGCGGQVITDEVRLTVAGRASVLLVGREGDTFSKLRTVLVYPSEYLAPDLEMMSDGTVFEGLDSRLGESWTSGAVVLAWDEVLGGEAAPRSCLDVVYHEFAHQLDAENGPVDGAPYLPSAAARRQWAEVLGREYHRLGQQVEWGRPTFLDPYAATHPAEFFAVLTEYFFVRPVPLRHHHPELYHQLRICYGQDPVSAP